MILTLLLTCFIVTALPNSDLDLSGMSHTLHHAAFTMHSIAYRLSPISVLQQPPDPDAIEQGRNMRVAIFLIISIVTSSLSLGIAFGIRRRIDQIGGPIEDEDD